MTTKTEARPMFLNTAAMARRLGVSRFTVLRWKLAGYTPTPCYAEGRVTLWSPDDIDAWIEAGCPWSDMQLADQAAKSHGGPIGLRKFIKPEYRPGGEPDSPAMDDLVEEFEEKLNECDALLGRMGSEESFRELANRTAAVRRELAIIRGG